MVNNNGRTRHERENADSPVADESSEEEWCYKRTDQPNPQQINNGSRLRLNFQQDNEPEPMVESKDDDCANNNNDDEDGDKNEENDDAEGRRGVKNANENRKSLAKKVASDDESKSDIQRLIREVSVY